MALRSAELLRASGALLLCRAGALLRADALLPRPPARVATLAAGPLATMDALLAPLLPGGRGAGVEPDPRLPDDVPETPRALRPVRFDSADGAAAAVAHRPPEAATPTPPPSPSLWPGDTPGASLRSPSADLDQPDRPLQQEAQPGPLRLVDTPALADLLLAAAPPPAPSPAPRGGPGPEAARLSSGSAQVDSAVDLTREPPSGAAPSRPRTSPPGAGAQGLMAEGDAGPWARPDPGEHSEETLEQLLDALAERLEFEYARIYGQQGR